MKKIYLTLLFTIIITNISGQDLIRKIESTYIGIDTVSYIKNVINSYVQKEKNNLIEMENLELSFSYKRMSEDSIHKHYQYLLEKSHDEFSVKIYRAKPIYVLNLVVNKDSIHNSTLVLEVDTSELNFNLFDFGKPHQTSLYVYCKNGEYASHYSEYITFSKRLGKNAPKVFKKITQKQPTYLLYCYELEGMNTILYVLNDTIYVYRIIEMKEYELNDYLKKFKSKILSNTIYRDL